MCLFLIGRKVLFSICYGLQVCIYDLFSKARVLCSSPKTSYTLTGLVTSLHLSVEAFLLIVAAKTKRRLELHTFAFDSGPHITHTHIQIVMLYTLTMTSEPKTWKFVNILLDTWAKNWKKNLIKMWCSLRYPLSSVLNIRFKINAVIYSKSYFLLLFILLSI